MTHPALASLLADEGRLLSLLSTVAKKVPLTFAAADRDDLFQEARIRLWRKQGDYRPEHGAPEAWAYTAAYRAMIDGLRRWTWIHGRTAARMARNGEAPPLMGHLGHFPDEFVENIPQSRDAAPTLDAIDAAESVLRRLRPKERVVFVRYHRDGRTMMQIGKELGLSESRICQIHTKALRRVEEITMKLRTPEMDARDDAIRAAVAAGEDRGSIADKFNVSVATTYNVAPAGRPSNGKNGKRKAEESDDAPPERTPPERSTLGTDGDLKAALSVIRARRKALAEQDAALEKVEEALAAIVG